MVIDEVGYSLMRKTGHDLKGKTNQVLANIDLESVLHFCRSSYFKKRLEAPALPISIHDHKLVSSVNFYFFQLSRRPNTGGQVRRGDSNSGFRYGHNFG